MRSSTRTRYVNGATHRLVIPAPDEGWLTLLSPVSQGRRLELAWQWQEATLQAARAAGTPPLARARVVAEARPARIVVSGPGIRHAEDVRPALHQVYEGLEAAGVLPRFNASRGRRVVAEALRLGVPTGEAAGQGYLVLELTEVLGA